MNLVDSSCWLEYFAGSAAGREVRRVIGKTEALLVPAVVLYEVFKKLLTESGEDNAIMAVAHMKQGHTVGLDGDLALQAARIGLEYKLPLVDSIIYATALLHDGLLWTQDRHFAGLPGVRYFAKG